MVEGHLENCGHGEAAETQISAMIEIPLVARWEAENIRNAEDESL